MNESDELEALKQALFKTTNELENRNKQFQQIKSGILGKMLGYGLWLTALTYTVAGISMTTETAPLAALGITGGLWFWKVLYSTTFVTACWLWFKPNSRIIETMHWLVPTLSLALTAIAILAIAIESLVTRRTDVIQSLLSPNGELLGLISVTYILVSQYTFLRLSILLKSGKPYQF